MTLPECDIPQQVRCEGRLTKLEAGQREANAKLDALLEGQRTVAARVWSVLRAGILMLLAYLFGSSK
jgi:endonuclease YncB( thermonuclease family)